MTQDQIDSIKRLQRLCGYYVNLASDYPKFNSERDVAQKINHVFAINESPTDRDFKNIADIFNEILGQNQYNGSAWYDFQIHLNSVYWNFGYKIDFKPTAEGQKRLVILSSPNI